MYEPHLPYLSTKLLAQPQTSNLVDFLITGIQPRWCWELFLLFHFLFSRMFVCPQTQTGALKSVFYHSVHCLSFIQVALLVTAIVFVLLYYFFKSDMFTTCGTPVSYCGMLCFFCMSTPLRFCHLLVCQNRKQTNCSHTAQYKSWQKSELINLQGNANDPVRTTGDLWYLPQWHKLKTMESEALSSFCLFSFLLQPIGILYCFLCFLSTQGL